MYQINSAIMKQYWDKVKQKKEATKLWEDMTNVVRKNYEVIHLITVISSLLNVRIDLEN